MTYLIMHNLMLESFGKRYRSSISKKLSMRSFLSRMIKQNLVVLLSKQSSNLFNWWIQASKQNLNLNFKKLLNTMIRRYLSAQTNVVCNKLCSTWSPMLSNSHQKAAKSYVTTPCITSMTTRIVNSKYRILVQELKPKIRTNCSSCLALLIQLKIRILAA